MLQRQLDPVADQRLPWQQLRRGGAESVAEPLDQAHAGLVAPDQHRRPRHQVGIGAGGDDDAVVGCGQPLHLLLEILETDPFAEGVGQVEDRIVGALAVNAAQLRLRRLRQLVEDHRAGLAHGGELRRVAE